LVGRDAVCARLSVISGKIFWKSTIDPVRLEQYVGFSYPGPFFAEFAT
jgi:hypothetical protein